MGYPTTVLLEDGQTTIAVYPKGHGKGAIVMKRSDDGRTWTELRPIGNFGGIVAMASVVKLRTGDSHSYRKICSGWKTFYLLP